MKQFKHYVLTILSIAIMWNFVSCSNFLQKEESESDSAEITSEMGFCIKLPGGSSSRAAYYDQNDAIYYRIIVSKNGTEVANKVGKPGESLKLSITEEGVYSIYASAYNGSDKLIAEGNADKSITLDDGWVKFSVVIYPKYKSVDVEVDIVWANSSESSSESNYVELIEDSDESIFGDAIFVTMTDNAIYYWNLEKQLCYVKSTSGVDTFKFVRVRRKSLFRVS